MDYSNCTSGLKPFKPVGFLSKKGFVCTGGHCTMQAESSDGCSVVTLDAQKIHLDPTSDYSTLFIWLGFIFVVVVCLVVCLVVGGDHPRPVSCGPRRPAACWGPVGWAAVGCPPWMRSVRVRATHCPPRRCRPRRPRAGWATKPKPRMRVARVAPSKNAACHRPWPSRGASQSLRPHRAL